MSASWDTFLLFLAVACGIELMLSRLRRLRKAAKFGGREELEPHAAHDLFYRGLGISEQSVVEALEIIATNIGVPLGYLRPHDRFAVELADVRGTLDGGLAGLTWETDVWLRLGGSLVDLSTIKTVEQYIEAIAPIIEAHHHPNEETRTRRRPGG